jgi:DUF438 domain-containing protein
MGDSSYSLLLDFALHLDNPATNSDRLELVKPYIKSVSAKETMFLVDDIMKRVDDIEKVKLLVTRMLHIFSASLNAKVRNFERGIPPLEELMKYNDTLNEKLDCISAILKEANVSSLTVSMREQLLQHVLAMTDSIRNYKIKEYRLFPLVERYIKEYRCLSLMWAIHDDVRSELKELQVLFSDEKTTLKQLNVLFGALFFDVKSMIMREEQVLFPTLLLFIPKNELLTLDDKQYESGNVDTKDIKGGERVIDLLTGNPTVKQLIQIFNTLPVDITFIDKNDKVVYFNTPEHRFFTRSKGVIGRTVQNCHPPKSMHIVEKILKAFKDGSRNEAEFLLSIQGKRIKIMYKAIRDTNGAYEGTLEISQDVTSMENLGSDKRLLDWK